MYALVCKVKPMNDVNGVFLGDSVVQVSEETFEVSGAFIWKEIDESNYDNLYNLYYLNDEIFEYTPPDVIDIAEPSVISAATVNPDPTITDQDLMI